jgi:hypothetical protein
VELSVSCIGISFGSFGAQAKLLSYSSNGVVASLAARPPSIFKYSTAVVCHLQMQDLS